MRNHSTTAGNSNYRDHCKHLHRLGIIDYIQHLYVTQGWKNLGFSKKLLSY